VTTVQYFTKWYSKNAVILLADQSASVSFWLYIFLKILVCLSRAQTAFPHTLFPSLSTSEQEICTYFRSFGLFFHQSRDCRGDFKGIFHPKIEITLMSFRTHKTFVRPQNTIDL